MLFTRYFCQIITCNCSIGLVPLEKKGLGWIALDKNHFMDKNKHESFLLVNGSMKAGGGATTISRILKTNTQPKEYD